LSAGKIAVRHDGLGLAHDPDVHESWSEVASRRSLQFPVSFGCLQWKGLVMISYCIASYRPHYSSLLIQDLVRKTTTPFEILVWLNVDDSEFERFLEEQQALGAPLRIVGKSPENIGMEAYSSLFQQARYELIVQIDDDVIAIS